ncbi:MAG TPA: hypothetical protein VGP89_02580 [Candidatus Angelobacter sp.]|jgi:hypothetical protein|nr:hypothetical protein [Candidatus Angelobacter sp.]
MRKVIYIGLVIALCWFAADCARAAELRVPQNAVAGQPLSIGTGGSGTLYLVGPGQVIKKEFKSGGNVEIKGEELRSAGRWIAVVRGDSNHSQVFWVKPGKPGKLNFLARPSRVPVARPNVISGVTFVFDQYQNLILDPTPVNFNLSVGGAGSTRSVTSHEGVAWINSASAPKAGAAQFVATVGDTSVTRVVQQVAADPCERSFRMHVAGHAGNRTVVETDPIRDCSGNPVPDGTIVTFMQTDKTGKSTVDARIKKGTARAELPASDSATITVAAGVVLGNELHVGGRQ